MRLRLSPSSHLPPFPLTGIIDSSSTPNNRWGESAGSISVALHMLANGGNTEGLFRAAFMESGNAIPTGYVDNEYLQSNYDGIVSDTGCAGSGDTLQCLREVPASVLKAAMDKTPSLVSYQVSLAAVLARGVGLMVAHAIASQLAMASEGGRGLRFGASGTVVVELSDCKRTLRDR